MTHRGSCYDTLDASMRAARDSSWSSTLGPSPSLWPLMNAEAATWDATRDATSVAGNATTRAGRHAL